MNNNIDDDNCFFTQFMKNATITMTNKGSYGIGFLAKINDDEQGKAFLETEPYKYKMLSLDDSKYKLLQKLFAFLILDIYIMTYIRVILLFVHMKNTLARKKGNYTLLILV